MAQHSSPNNAIKWLAKQAIVRPMPGTSIDLWEAPSHRRSHNQEDKQPPQQATNFKTQQGCRVCVELVPVPFTNAQQAKLCTTCTRSWVFLHAAHAMQTCRNSKETLAAQKQS